MSTQSAVPTGHLPPLVPLVDSTHQAASIIIATSTLLFTALLFVGARLYVRYSPDEEQKGRIVSRASLLGGDDLLLVVSTLLYIVHTVLLLSACSHGLGNSIRSIPLGVLGDVQKLYYTANIFYVLSLGCSKASVSYLMVRINALRSPMVTQSMKGILYLVALWTVAMLFVFIFMCGASSPWVIVSQRCPDWYLKWAILGATGCCFEVAIAGIAVWNVWSLQTTLLKKAVVVSLFALRLPLIIIVGIALSTVSQTAFTTDPTLNPTLFICLSELTLCYSICSANFPAFRRLTSDIRTDFGGFGTAGSFHASNKYGSNKASFGYIRSGNGPASDTFPTTASTSFQAKRRSKTPDLAGRGPDGVGYLCEVRNGDAASLSSNAISNDNGSEDMIIRARTEVTVRHDE